VTLETWSRWSEEVEAEGMRFVAAPEYQVFPTMERPLKPYQAAARASAVTRELIREVDPEVVVADILTIAAGLAAELEERPWATLVPHLLPTGGPGFPVYAVGAVLPRTRAGRRMWELTRPLLMRGEEQGRRELNDTRARVGLPPLAHVHGGISRRLALVATFPQLEYPRAVPQPGAVVTGPLLWEPTSEGVFEPPPGDAPLVLIAPSTSQDPAGNLLREALEGLAGEPVRVLASTNRRGPEERLPTPPNARLVDWLPYSRVMPHCDAVVCHVGHGTLALALAGGAPVVACPHAGDMAENAARVRWSGVGVSLPRRFHTRRGIRLAVRRLLADPGHAERARELRDWTRRNDGPSNAADAVERLAAAGPT
jgi:UDP:flavonoid glycosyltransferase YjiC (YdhE family)